LRNKGEIMKRFAELTIKELVMMKVALENWNYGCGGTTLEDLHADNYSWIGVSYFEKHTGFSKHQVAGLVGSLQMKNVLTDIEEEGFCFINDCWFDGKFEDADVLAEYCKGE